jgi:hypothetical protein
MAGVALTALLGTIAAALTLAAYRASRLPFNSEGRFFDGVVSRDTSAPLVYAMLAAVGWLLVLLMVTLLRGRRRIS